MTQEKHEKYQLPPEVMKKAVKGITYISHPLRLRILEFLDVNGPASVTMITRAMGEEQAIVSQSLKKLRDAHLVTTRRRGLFIFYAIAEEYPASLFVCMRKLFGYMTDNFWFMQETYKELLPRDYTTMAANQIKLFANYDKMRILEYLNEFGPASVSQIVDGTGASQMKVSQYLKRLRDDGFVVSRREGRYVIYAITKGVHQTAIGCIHKRYDGLADKSAF